MVSGLGRTGSIQTQSLLNVEGSLPTARPVVEDAADDREPVAGGLFAEPASGGWTQIRPRTEMPKLVKMKEMAIHLLKYSCSAD
jgi:hypothetical protein